MFFGYWDKRWSPAADSKSEKEEGGKARFQLSRGHVKKSCHLQLLVHCGADDAGSADGVFGSWIGRDHVYLSCSSLAPGFAASQRLRTEDWGLRTEPHRSAPLPTSSFCCHHNTPRARAMSDIWASHSSLALLTHRQFAVDDRFNFGLKPLVLISSSLQDLEKNRDIKIRYTFDVFSWDVWIFQIDTLLHLSCDTICRLQNSM